MTAASHKRPARQTLDRRWSAMKYEETHRRLQAERDAKRMRELDDAFSAMLADAMDLELNCARFRQELGAA